MAIEFQGRRLSWLRLSVLLIIISLLIAVGYGLWFRAKDSQAANQSEQWFGAYVDASSTPFYDIGSNISRGERVVLGFMVAHPEAGCTPSWGGYYTMDEANETFDLERKVARVHDAGGQVVVSSGGLLNDELATACEDVTQIAQGYRQVLERYDSRILDLDIEADDLTNLDGGLRRAEAVALLQEQTPVEVWLTLPAATFGMAPEGLAEVERVLAAGVELAGVNLMTMNFGETRDARQSMGQASIEAAESAHRQLDAIYAKHSQQLGEQSLWRKIGVTPMIGQNDLLGEVFDLQDAEQLNAFVQEKGLGRISFWSANRDQSCGENFPDLTRVSNNCSGVQQAPGEFAQRLAVLEGHTPSPAPSPTPSAAVQSAPVETEIADDPATSPYPIWSDLAAYVEGDRIVWRKNVYEAKWWNQNNAPDAPATNGQPSPWQLVGPVLPGDKPLTVLKAPEGIYPQWDPEETYTEGDRVWFEDRILQARWWNTAQSPQAALQGAAASPWQVLDNAEVQKILDEQANPSATASADAQPSATTD
ncbi:chitinase [Glutamicibacter uratoxydans]|uniref:chitinase n=1 Tax=Glutamicibacter uratoxydans TaxID=43667 RepID=UPI003D7015F8